MKNINNALDKLSIVIEKEFNSIEALYENHIHKCKFSIDENSTLQKDDLINLSNSVIQLLDIEQTEYYFDENLDGFIEFSIMIENENEFKKSDIIINVKNHINNLLMDSEKIIIGTLIHNIYYNEESKKLDIILNLKLIPYNFFDSNDIQIRAIEDYLLLKSKYGLSENEISKLSKKQKRYLIFKLKNNKE